MIERDAVVVETRSWTDTPFHHQASLKGVGVDCLGLVRGVARAFSGTEFEIPAYGRMPDPRAMGDGLRRYLDEVTKDPNQPWTDVLRTADILWLRIAVEPQHLSIVTETAPRLMMIHALFRPGMDSRVIETEIGLLWLDRIVGCFRFRGVE